jgi:molybdenum cofactor guanylyltransferase
MTERTQYSAIILAGGKSSRMGRPKADLKFEGGTMLDYIVAEMMRVFEDVVVAVSEHRLYAWEEASYSARSIVDRARYRGPVAALEQALRAVEFDRTFVCSCDVPFVSGDLARKLCDMLGDHDALIPQVEGKLQPLHAVYRKNCAKILATMREQKQNRLQDVVNFAKVRVVPEEEIRALDPDPRLTSFFNVNTPEDYQRAIKLMGERDRT